MIRRLAIASLWFAAGTYAGSFISFLLDGSPILAPALGASAALLVSIGYLRDGKAVQLRTASPQKADRTS